MRRNIIAQLKLLTLKYWLLGLWAAVFTCSTAAAAPQLMPDIAVTDADRQIIINIPALTLYLLVGGEPEQIYPIGVGKAKTPTPVGDYQIGERAHNPTWYIPPTIKKERKQRQLPEIDSLPPGPANPLGPIFIRFGLPQSGYGIHGTNAPGSVPGVVTHGCVRLHSQDALALDKKISLGDELTLLYQLYALNIDAAGHLWLQKFPNFYGRADTDLEKIKSTLALWEQENGTITAGKSALVFSKKKSPAVCLNCPATVTKISPPLQSLAWTENNPAIRAAAAGRAIDEKLLYEGLHNPVIDPPRFFLRLLPPKTD